MDLLQKFNMVAFAYPVAIAVSLISFGLYSAIVIREHYSARKIFGMVCAGCGLILIAL